MAEYMGARDQKRWAKEVIMNDIDESLKSWYNDIQDSAGEAAIDDLMALRNERNRVAKFLGHKPKSLTELWPQEKV